MTDARNGQIDVYGSPDCGRMSEMRRGAVLIDDLGDRFTARSDNGDRLEDDVLGCLADEAARRIARSSGSENSADEAAARAALGLSQHAGIERDIALEALKDHTAVLCVRAPRVLRRHPDAAALAAARAAARDNGDALRLALFGRSGAPQTLSDLESWMQAGETEPARVLRHLWERWDSRWGRGAPQLWRPDHRWRSLDWRSAELDGEPVDISVAALTAHAPIMRSIAARRGRGLAWRFVGRLEAARILIEGLSHGGGASSPRAIGPGVGMAEDSRGATLMIATTMAGRVRSFARVSATDCALHPKGALAVSLAAAPAHEPSARRMVAEMALEIIDPRAARRAAEKRVDA